MKIIILKFAPRSWKPQRTRGGFRTRGLGCAITSWGRNRGRRLDRWRFYGRRRRMGPYWIVGKICKHDQIRQGFSTFISSFTSWQNSKVKFTPQIFYIFTSTNPYCNRQKCEFFTNKIYPQGRLNLPFRDKFKPGREPLK